MLPFAMPQIHVSSFSFLSALSTLSFLVPEPNGAGRESIGRDWARSVRQPRRILRRVINPPKRRNREREQKVDRRKKESGIRSSLCILGPGARSLVVEMNVNRAPGWIKLYIHDVHLIPLASCDFCVRAETGSFDYTAVL